MASIDWIAIKNEYINTNTSQRKLAKKYNVSEKSINKKSTNENWVALRKDRVCKSSAKVLQKTADITIKKEVNRIEKMLKIGDTAQEKIQLALSQLNKYVTASGGIAENELVDVDRLRKLVSALKDIKDIVREDKSTDNSDIWGEIVREYTKI